MLALTVVTADAPRTKRSQKKAKDFWDSLSRNEQDEYLKAHPNSKYKHLPKKPKSGKTSTPVEGEPKPKKKLIDLIKDFHEDQKKFFQRGNHKPDSKERTKLSKLMVRKKEGFKKSIKSEVHEWEHAMDAIRLLKKGEKLDSHHKKALKSLGAHSAFVIGDLAATGGMNTLGAAVGGFISGFIAHTVGIHVGKTAVWAATQKPDKDFDKMTNEELLDWYVENLANSVRTVDVPTKDWLKAVKKQGAKHAKSKPKK